MWFLWFYIISTALVVFVAWVTALSIMHEYKRKYPNAKRKYKNTIAESIRAWFAYFIPFFNLLLIFICIFMYDTYKDKAFEAMDEVYDKE